MSRFSSAIRAFPEPPPALLRGHRRGADDHDGGRPVPADRASERSQTDARLSQAQTVVAADRCASWRPRRARWRETIGRDQRLGERASQAENERRSSTGSTRSPRDRGAPTSTCALTALGDFESGSPPAMAPDSRRLVDESERADRPAPPWPCCRPTSTRTGSRATPTRRSWSSRATTRLASTSAPRPADAARRRRRRRRRDRVPRPSFDATAVGGPVRWRCS